MSAAYSIWRAAYTEEFPDDPLPTAPEVLARAHGPEISAASRVLAAAGRR